MQVEAMYVRGRLEFSTPIRFARDRFPVVVELPDSEVITENRAQQPEISTPVPDNVSGSKMLDQIRKILGPLDHMRSPVSVEENKAAYEEALMEKYGR